MQSVDQNQWKIHAECRSRSVKDTRPRKLKGSPEILDISFFQILEFWIQWIISESTYPFSSKICTRDHYDKIANIKSRKLES